MITGIVIGGICCLLGFLFFKLSVLHLLTKSVDKTSDHYGGELVAKVLKSHGVKHVFTLCGGHISPILAGCEKESIRVIDVRHEATAAFAADAVSRMSYTLGVVVVTAGPGLTNTVTALKNAQMAESPVLLLGGAAPILAKNKGALQDIDQISLLRSVCKKCFSVQRIRDIVPTLRNAIYTLRSGTPGPVFVELAVDILYPYKICAKEIGIVEKAKGIRHAVVNAYLKYHLFNLFAGGFDIFKSHSLVEKLKPIPVATPTASESKIDKAVKIIKSGKKPLLLFGSQAMIRSYEGFFEEFPEKVKNMNIPCYLGGVSRGLLGSTHRLLLRHQRKRALLEADVIILAGSVCDFRLGYGRNLNSNAKIISINRNRRNLLLNEGVFWKAELAIQADVASTIVRISEKLVGWTPSTEWVSLLQDRDAAREEEIVKEAAKPSRGNNINVLELLLQVERHGLEERNTIIIGDGGDFLGSAAYILKPRGPFSWLDPGTFGTLGVGGGFALGAKLCHPEADVWIIYGDGSLGYSICEFDTFVRHKLPVIALVGNDACWSQILRGQASAFNSTIACELLHTSYEVVAKGFGAEGFLLNGENKHEMVNMFDRCKEVTRAKNLPVLLNCLIDKSDFRDGSISL